MKSRLAPIALLGLISLVAPLSARAGGTPPTSATPNGTWKTVLTVGPVAGLAIDTRGDPAYPKWAYTANPYSRTLIKFGTGGSRLAAWKYGPPVGYVSPVGVAVGGSGNVFVADGGTDRVVKFDPFGRQIAAFKGFGLPAGIAVDSAGNIYVAEERALLVTKLSPSGRTLARWHVPWVNGTGTAVPLSVAVDRQGNVYVGADCYRDECPEPHGIQYAVLKLSPSGALIGGLLGNNPYVNIGPGEQAFVTVTAVSVDAMNDVYVGSSAIRNSRGDFVSGVLVYRGGPSPRTTYTIPGKRAPTGIDFDGRNTLYVAYDNRIIKRLP